MKYSMSNWIYGNEPLRVTFQRLQKYGYDGVELVGEPQMRQKALKYASECVDLAVAVGPPW